MKLILKHNNNVRIYAEKLDYETLIEFTLKQFQLLKSSIRLTFQDDQNDNITILSNDDLEVLQQVFDGKQFIKVDVQGTVAIEKSQKVVKSKQISETSPLIADKNEVECGLGQSDQRRQKCKKMRDRQCSRSKEHSSENRKKSHKKERYQKMDCYLNEKITKLVDQRIKQLLPCLKEQLNRKEQGLAEISSPIIHLGVQCKGCNVNTITGIRYQCLTCPSFNLCQRCEARIEHEHNLLKMKTIQEEKKSQEDFDKFHHQFGKFFKHHGHRGHHGHGHHGKRQSSSSRSKQRCHRQKGPHYMKKIWGLAFLFGGQPHQYSSFVEENEDLKPRETFKKYAKLVNLSDEDFKTRFVNMRCQKLSRCFDKPAEEYKAFVEQNIDMTQKEMINAIYDKGIEKRENKRCWWGGRKFNFNDACEGKKEQTKKEQTKKKGEKSCSKEPKKERFEISPSLLTEPKPVDTQPSVKRAKGALFTKMVDLFGEGKKRLYTKFIDTHFTLGQENYVINLLIEHLSSK